MADSPSKRSDEMKGVNPPSQSMSQAPLPPAAIKPQGALPKRETLRITLPKSARSTKKSTRLVPKKAEAPGATTMPIEGAPLPPQGDSAWTTQVTQPMPAKFRQQPIGVATEEKATEALSHLPKEQPKPETAKVSNPGLSQGDPPRPSRLTAATMQAKTPSEPLLKPGSPKAAATPALPKPPAPKPPGPPTPPPSAAPLPKPPAPPKPPGLAEPATPPKPVVASAKATPPPEPPKLSKKLVGKMTDKINTPKELPKASETTPTPMPTQALTKPQGSEIKAMTGLKKPPAQPVDDDLTLKLRPKTTVLTPMPTGALDKPSDSGAIASGAPVLKVENEEAAGMKVQEARRPTHPPTISSEQSELLLRKKTAPVKLTTGADLDSPVAAAASQPQFEPPPHDAAPVYDPEDPKGKISQRLPLPPNISTQQNTPGHVKKMALPKSEAPDATAKPTPSVKPLKPVIQLKESKPGPASETGRISSKISGVIAEQQSKSAAQKRPEVQKIDLPDSSRIIPEAGKGGQKRPSGPIPKPQVFYAKPQDDSSVTAQLTRPIEEEIQPQKKDPMDAPKPPPAPAQVYSPPTKEPEKVTREIQGKEVRDQVEQAKAATEGDPTVPRVTGPMPASLKASVPPPAGQATAGIKPPAPPSKPTPPPAKPTGVAKTKSEPPPPPPAAVIKRGDKIEVPAASAGPTIPISPAPGAPKPPAPSKPASVPAPPSRVPPQPAAAPGVEKISAPKPPALAATDKNAPTVALPTMPPKPSGPPKPVPPPSGPTAAATAKPTINAPGAPKPPAPAAPKAGGPKPPAPAGGPKPPAPVGGPKPPAPAAPKAGGPKPPAPAGGPKPPAAGVPAAKPSASPAVPAKPKPASGTAAIKPGASPRKETVQIKAGIMPKKPGPTAARGAGSPTPKPMTPAPSSPKPASKPLAGGAGVPVPAAGGTATATLPKADNKPAPMPMMAPAQDEENKPAMYMAGAAAAISWLTATYLALAYFDMLPF